MARIKPKKIIEKVLISPIFISFMVFLLASLVVYRLTITKVDLAYNKEFIRDVLVEAHGMLFDILIIGTFIFALHTVVESRREKKRNIQRWQEEIDDFRGWESEEAKVRILGNIKRLNRNGITDINLVGCFLEEANLNKANLKRADLEDVNLKGAFLWDANLYRANLQTAHLEGASLRDVNLKGAFLWDAHLEGANLCSAHLEGAFLFMAYLNRANLKEADLEGACLNGADLKRADLTGANLKRADLNGADLKRADLERADLERADLERADFEEAKNLTIKQLSKVKTLFEAKIDPEFMQQIREKYTHLLEKPKEEDRDKQKPDFSDFLDHESWLPQWKR